MTWLILDDITQQVVPRSAVRTALDNTTPNLRAEFPNIQMDEGLTADAGELHRPIHSVSDLIGQHDASEIKLPRFSPDELTGMTFLRELDNGRSCRAKIVQKILDKDAQNHQNIKFLVKVGDNDFDEIISYIELSAIVEDQLEQQTESPETAVWAFTGITGHEGPFLPTHPNYKGSSYNVSVQWDDGSETMEPLDVMIKDDPVSVANYAA